MEVIVQVNRLVVLQRDILRRAGRARSARCQRRACRGETRDCCESPVPASEATCGLLEAASITVIWPPTAGLSSRRLEVHADRRSSNYAASDAADHPPETGQVVTTPVSSTNGPPKTAV